MHPSHRYIRFVLASTWASDDPPDIDGVVRDLRLLPVSEEELNRIKLTFAPPPGFDFDRRDDDATAAFMKAEKLMTLWNPRRRDVDDVGATLAFLKKWRARDAVETLLLGRVAPEKIAEAVNQLCRLRPAIDANVINIYSHFFWHVDDVAPDEWHALLLGHPRREGMLAALHCGEDQALYQIGATIKPPKDPTGMLQQALMQAYFNLQVLRSQPITRAGIAMQEKLTVIIERLSDRLYDSGLLALRREAANVRQFVMVHRDPAVMTVEQVVSGGGSISGDGSEG